MKTRNNGLKATNPDAFFDTNANYLLCLAYCVLGEALAKSARVKLREFSELANVATCKSRF